ncbi:MAG: hypothetical protein J6Y20_12445, partial [Lachnospiraceae bacterium]|nr:hypothetical protein [Lachnospiraceae bacterium]
EKAFMAERIGCSAAEMNARFRTYRDTLVKGKVVEDIPADKMTMEQAKDLVEAIYASFMSDNSVEKMIK